MERLSYSFFAVIAIIKVIIFQTGELAFPESAHPDQTGKVWIVTGGTSGIGYEVSLRLAELGAHVWLVGRDAARTKEYVDEIRAKVANAKVDYIVMDLADLTSIKPGVAKFFETKSPLHGIIHNAGVMAPPAGSVTAQGIELQLGTNNLAPWLLQKLLDPVLLESTKSVEGRILWVASGGHLLAPWSGDKIVEDPTRVGYFPRGDAYAITKAINIMQSIQWTKIHPRANVRSTSVHPGFLRTNLGRSVGNVGKWMAHQVCWPAYYGAISELAAAIGDVPNNSYVIPWGLVGDVRPDIVVAAERDTKLSEWLDEQIDSYM